ncbi:hypothetical protein PSTG_07955 [Puccinia striiformis f. sp. tritici PST-78]|uniref:Uncharacterized protein n=1 Tax=Puccinia striiformis f. sp. tritici PST-78 TaxID=1165861 RepID=A0A0L0UPZ6_9BASI|nr:hypothetical protein PSTG_17684 [Puccinia striiformis f. sp. tritici PST-78]KNE98768.1 hypothetical protein PSTG_07955 [Puccinia striiformis f. sp. tritici PST-78]
MAEAFGNEGRQVGPKGISQGSKINKNLQAKAPFGSPSFGILISDLPRIRAIYTYRFTRFCGRSQLKITNSRAAKRGLRPYTLGAAAQGSQGPRISDFSVCTPVDILGKAYDASQEPRQSIWGTGPR